MATRSLNKVILIGNLTRDPELRYTSSGTPVATFTVATNRSFTDSAGTQKETAEFTNVVSWAKLAEICSQLLTKGTKVYVEGRLQTSSWDDKETGKQVRRTEVVITDMIVLSGARSNYNNAASEENMEQASENVDLDAIDQGVNFDEIIQDSEQKKTEKKDEKTQDDDTNTVPF
jgi:single-strand DNA-binding protein